MTLLRFGWIDADDWRPQRSPTGQMAGLAPSVYAFKLVPIPGTYQLQAPVTLLKGIGKRLGAALGSLGIHTINDLLSYGKPLPRRLAAVRISALADYSALSAPHLSVKE